MKYVRRHWMEFLMTGLLVVSFLILSKQAAQVDQAVQADNAARAVSRAEKSETVMVDAGHGGTDPGMIGIGNLEEKEINLQIAFKLKKVLENRGYTVIMSREEDRGLYEENSRNQKTQDMQQRIALIRKYSPVLCVSIHQNSYQDSEVYGPQVFYYEDSAQGKELAELIQRELNQDLEIEHPRTARGNKTYYLLKRSESVLNIVECGFLTNPKEAELLQTEEYQEKVAEAVAKGIEAYLNE